MQLPLPYVPAGGGSPDPLPILKSQLTEAMRRALGVSLDTATQISLPTAEMLAQAWSAGKTALTDELLWQLEAAGQIHLKRLSKARREAFAGVIQAAFGVANYALTGGLAGLLGGLLPPKAGG